MGQEEAKPSLTDAGHSLTAAFFRGSLPEKHLISPGSAGFATKQSAHSACTTYTRVCGWVAGGHRGPSHLALVGPPLQHVDSWSNVVPGALFQNGVISLIDCTLLDEPENPDDEGQCPRCSSLNTHRDL